MKKNIFVSLAAILLFSLNSGAQNVIDLVISEVMAKPDSTTSFLDDYGRKEGWIEIFNTSQGTVNIGGCFLTDDKSNLKKSLIPKGDSRTSIGPRQVALFFASGRGNDGTFYTGFEIGKGKTIYLVSNDGRTIVDSLKVPAGLPDGMSVSKFPVDNKQLRYEARTEPTEPSPMIPNGDQNAESNSQKMARTDPHGFILTLVSVSVVFGALAILWFLFWIFFERPAKKKAQPKKAALAGTKNGGTATPETAAAIAMALDMKNGGDVYAAIATALHLYLSDAVHDNESFIITIKRPETSRWNDKSQTFRRLPR